MILLSVFVFVFGTIQAQNKATAKANAETLYSSDFETYLLGEMVALDDETGYWTTWTDDPGGEEDAIIVNEESASPTKSAKVDGVTDLVFKMGDRKTGKYQFNFKIYVPSNFGGYYNIQHYEEPGLEWAYNVFFGSATGDNNGYLENGSPAPVSFTYMHDSWVLVENIFDLNNDTAQLYIGGTLVDEWKFSNESDAEGGKLQLGGADLWAGAPDDDVPLYYFDDVEFIELEAAIQEPVMKVVSDNPIFVSLEQWDETIETFTIGNEGVADLNYEVVINYPNDEAKAPTPQPESTIKQVKTFGEEQNFAKPGLSPALTNPSERETVLHYDGENNNAIGQGADYTYIVAAQFPSEMVMPYIGMTIDRVDIYCNEFAQNAKIKIFGMGSYLTGGPGELIYEQSFVAEEVSWNTVMLDTPIEITGQDISVGWESFGLGGTFVPGVDAGPADPNGNWLSTNGGSWTHLSSSLDYNWNVRAYIDGEPITQWLSVSPTEGTLAKDETAEIEVTINAADLDPVAYHGQLFVRGNDPNNDSETIDVWADVAVGVDEFGEKNYIMVYPNPAKDILRISSNGELQHIRLMNSIGQVVIDEDMNAAKAQYNIGHLDAGIYFIQAETKFGTSTQKLIIK